MVKILMELVILINAMKNNVSGEGAHSERVVNGKST